MLAIKNALLAELPAASARHLLASAEFESVNPGAVIFGADVPMTRALFPIEGIASILIPGDQGRNVEVALVGNEGCLGIPLFFGEEIPRMISIARSPMYSVAVSAAVFKEELETNRVFANLIQSYTYSFLCAISIGAACAVTHRVEQRCARWLLSAQDRLKTDVFRLTHQDMANNLGVRRASVTTAVAKLQKQGAVVFTHGQASIASRDHLARISCSCYERIRAEYERPGSANKQRAST